MVGHRFNLLKSICLVLMFVLISISSYGKWEDYELSLDLKSTDDDTITILFRYQNTRNFYAFSWRKQGSWRGIQRKSNGQTVTLASDQVPYVTGQWYKFKARVNGNEIEISIDNQIVFSVVDDALSYGAIALISNYNRGSHFDNLKVTNISDAKALIDYSFSEPSEAEDFLIRDPFGKTSGWAISSGSFAQLSNIFGSTFAYPRSAIEENAILFPHTLDTNIGTILSNNQSDVGLTTNKSRQAAIVWKEVDGDGMSTVRLSVLGWDQTFLLDALQVHSLTTGNLSNLEIAISDSGNIWMVWQEDQDGDGLYNIVAKAYDINGAVLVPAFIVNSNSLGSHINASISLATNEELLIGWEFINDIDGSSHILLRGFNFQGAEVYAEQTLNAGSGGQHRKPDIAIISDTKLVFTFEDDSDNNGYFQIHANILDLNNSSLGTEFFVNSVATGQQYQPSVAVDSKQNFYISFEDEPTNSLLVRGFNPDGSELFPDKKVFMFDDEENKNAKLTGLKDGFIASWEETVVKNNISKVYFASRMFDSFGLELNDDLFWPVEISQDQANVDLEVFSENEIIGAWLSDTNLDGKSEVYFSTRIFYTDTDGDGTADQNDAFPTDSFEWLDTDNDSIGNNSDLDDDNDGIPDIWESANGLNPLISNSNADSDGDGATDYQEYLDSTNPLDYESCVNVSCLVFLEATWTYTYHATNGQIETADGPRTDLSDLTIYAYDANANVSSITNALGHVLQFPLYDGSGRVLQSIDANGIVTDVSYTVRGLLQSSTVRHPTNAALDQATTYGYDAVGQLTSVTLPNGSVVTYEYDGARRLTAIQDNVGNRIEYTLDAAGNRTAEVIKNDLGAVTQLFTRAFDELSRVMEITGAANQSESYSYDANDNLTDTINGRNYLTSQEYDALNRVSSVIDALNNDIDYTYDSQDNLTGITDQRGLTTSYTYDGLGNLTEINSPDTGLTTFTHDEAGNVTSQTDARGVVINYQYDALNRLISETHPTNPGLNKTYTYDDTANGNVGIGRLTAVQDSVGGTTYRFDFVGNLVDSLQTVFGTAYTTTYEYDNLGLVTALTYPGARRVDISRNSLGQITAMSSTDPTATTTTTLADSIAYLPFGPLTQLNYGNGLALNRNYDLDYRLSQQTVGSLDSLTYLYDGNNNITDIDKTNIAQNQDFIYDELDRLVSEDGDYGLQTYQYDAVGNRLQKQTPTATQTLTYDSASNQLQSVDGEAIGYDATGNSDTRIINGNVYEYRHDEDERYEALYINAQLIAGYYHNAQGQRTQKRTYSGGQIQSTTVYHYDQSGQLIAATHKDNLGATTHIVHTVWLNDLPIAQITDYYSSGQVQGTDLVYIHADHLNTPRLATNASQTVVWTWNSDAFGVGAANQDPDNDTNQVVINLRFPGQQFDEESGLHYNYFRDYDPSLGRYIQSDPIGLGDGPNTYAYAHSNPVKFIDRLGLWVKRCARKLGDPDNPAKKPSGNPLRHDYLSVSGQILSFQAGDNMYWSQGFIDDNEHAENDLCTLVCGDDKFDKYVLEAAREIGAPTYCVVAYPGTTPHLLGARNCQTWASDVLKLAKKKYLEEEDCPECFQ